MAAYGPPLPSPAFKWNDSRGDKLSSKAAILSLSAGLVLDEQFDAGGEPFLAGDDLVIRHGAFPWLKMFNVETDACPGNAGSRHASCCAPASCASSVPHQAAAEARTGAGSRHAGSADTRANHSCTCG